MRPTPATSPRQAALWMIGAIVAFTTMAVAAREVSPVHDSFEIMTARSAIGFVIVAGLGAATGKLGGLTTHHLGGHFLRNIVHFTGQNLWFWALTMIPLAQVFALEFTAPIWVILLAPLVLGESLTRIKLIAAAFGFTGIVIAVLPGLGLPGLGLPGPGLPGPGLPGLANLNPGVLAAAAAALFFALTSILTKAMTKDTTRGDPVFAILFWLTLMQFCFGLIGAGYDGTMALPTAATLPWLALIGGAGVLAHLSLTTALSLAPASFVVPLDFIRLPVITVVGAWAYAEPADPWVLLGAAVIFIGVWLNLRATLRPKQHIQKATNP